MKVHLVDGTFELFRAHFARPAERAPDGRPVAAVHGLLESMMSLLREPDVTHVGVATDHVIESWRNDLFAGYKSSAGMPPELLEQFALAERALESLGLVVWPMVEDEADDALATGVARYGAQASVQQVVICSVDKDLTQCVSGDRVVLRDRMRRVTYDEAGVQAKFGVTPESIPDYLALVGDSSDGYPGLPGWGAKSASTILARWRHLDLIPASVLDWDVPLRGASTLSATLQQHMPEALLYRRLATLNPDAPIAGELDDLAWRGAPRAEFLALCDELGFERLRERVDRWA
jgi:5'-3' exonuclease